MKKKGTVYLIPSVIAPQTAQSVLAPQVLAVVKNTRHYIAETIRESRRFISSLGLGLTITNLDFTQVTNNTPHQEIKASLEPAMQGHDIGVLSDAGCPGVADPGAQVVALAHKIELQVVPLVGPSSLLLALMASGFNGQSFAFNGYLPIDTKAARHALLSFEKMARKQNQTQMFIETPYRSDRTLALLLQTLGAETKLCLAKDITGTQEFIKTKTVAAWRTSTPQIGKAPTVFLFLP